MSLKRSRSGSRGRRSSSPALLVLVWVVVVWRWDDPFTALYTHWERHQLAHSYNHRFDDVPPATGFATESGAADHATVAQEGRRYRARLQPGPGDPAASACRALGLNRVLVNGP